MCTCECLIKCEQEWTDMSEQMLKMKLQHLTNMGNWETGKHVQYVQCTVYTVRTVYSTCKWDRVVRTVVQYVLWCHNSAGRLPKKRDPWARTEAAKNKSIQNQRFQCCYQRRLLFDCESFQHWWQMWPKHWSPWLLLWVPMSQRLHPISICSGISFRACTICL